MPGVRLRYVTVYQSPWATRNVVASERASKNVSNWSNGRLLKLSLRTRAPPSLEEDVPEVAVGDLENVSVTRADTDAEGP